MPFIKKCPECNAVIHAAYQKCPQCEYEFPPPEKNKHHATASAAGIISGQVNYIDYDVKSVEFSIHYKRGAEPGTPRTMRVEYCVGWQQFISEWVCPEHTGYARAKFEKWWAKRSKIAPPESVEDAVIMGRDGALATPHQITVKNIAGEKFDCVVNYQLDPIPEYIPEPGWNDVEDYDAQEEYELDDIPF